MLTKFEEIYSYAPEWRELVSKKKQELLNKDIHPHLENISVDIHNATWCPDCVRETVELMALLSVNSTPVDINIYSYEDLRDYKDKKNNKSLPINCLPTFIFKTNDKEVSRVEEDSSNKLLEILNNL